MGHSEMALADFDEVERFQLVDDGLVRDDGILAKSILVCSSIYSTSQAQAHHHRVCDLQRAVDYFHALNEPQVL